MTLAPRPDRQIGRRQPDAASGAEHQHDLARGDRPAVAVGVEHRRVALHATRGLGQPDSGRNGKQPRCRHRHLLGEAPGADHGDGPIADRPPRHAVAQPDDRAGDLAARREGQRRLELILAADNQGVDEVDARGSDLEHHGARPRRRLLHLVNHERARRSELGANHLAHWATVGVDGLATTRRIQEDGA